MYSTGRLYIFSMIFCFEMCTCRYVVPARPPVELKNPDSYHPEAEFRDHALRVGNIIADLLRSEIRLMLKINSTIADGKKHHHRRNRSQHHHHESEEHTRSEESHSIDTYTSEEPRVKVLHSVDHHPGENRPHIPVKDPKVTHTHETNVFKNVDKDVELRKSTDCVCPVVSDSAAQPNTLMLEQKIYGASSSRDTLDSNSPSPLIVQKFIWNPQNVSQVPSAITQEASGQTSPQVLNHPGVTKPSSTSITTPSMGKNPSVTLNNREHTNTHSSQTMSGPTASSTPAKKPAKQASYNPLALAGLEGTTETNIERMNPLGLQDQQGVEQESSDILLYDPPEVEGQGHAPNFELLETTNNEKPSEEVKEEVIEVLTASEY